MKHPVYSQNPNIMQGLYNLINYKLSNICCMFLFLPYSKLKSVTACCLSSAADQLLLGTESGNIHVVTLPDLALSNDTVYQETLMQK